MSAKSMRSTVSEEVARASSRGGGIPIVRAHSSGAAGPDELRPAPLSFPFLLSWHATAAHDAAAAERSSMREAPAQHPALSSITC